MKSPKWTLALEKMTSLPKSQRPRFSARVTFMEEYVRFRCSAFRDPAPECSDWWCLTAVEMFSYSIEILPLLSLFPHWNSAKSLHTCAWSMTGKETYMQSMQSIRIEPLLTANTMLCLMQIYRTPKASTPWPCFTFHWTICQPPCVNFPRYPHFDEPPCQHHVMV